MAFFLLVFFFSHYIPWKEQIFRLSRGFSTILYRQFSFRLISKHLSPPARVEFATELESRAIRLF